MKNNEKERNEWDIEWDVVGGWRRLRIWLEYGLRCGRRLQADE